MCPGLTPSQLARQVGEIGNSLCSMVARSGVVFPASMAAILANPMEILFDSFTTRDGNG
jgi:hypothetical protein